MKFKNLGLLIRSVLTGYRGEWETLCNGCGSCCYEKNQQEDGTIYIDFDKPCPHLDTYSNNCSVYRKRFKVCRECSRLGAWHALYARWLPPDCGYVKKFRN